MSPERRIFIAVKVLDAVRANIAAARGAYHGSMVPNLQSVQDVLTLPEAIVERSLITSPQFNVSEPEAQAAVNAAWAGE